MNQMKKPGIGELLVHEGLISEAQLNEALLVQKNQNMYKPLGELCVELKFLSRSDLNRILDLHQKRIKLGQLLINLGLITQERLDQGFEEQRQKGGKLGDILVRKGFISENALISALSIQMGVPKIVPDYQLIDKSLLEAVSEEFLKKNEILPAFKENDSLTVIMSNPLNERTIRMLKDTYKCKIRPAIASSREIRKTIREHFHKDKHGKKAGHNLEPKALISYPNVV